MMPENPAYPSDQKSTGKAHVVLSMMIPRNRYGGHFTEERYPRGEKHMTLGQVVKKFFVK